MPRNLLNLNYELTGPEIIKTLRKKNRFQSHKLSQSTTCLQAFQVGYLIHSKYLIHQRGLGNIVVNIMALLRIESLFDLIMVLIAISLIYLLIIISIFKKNSKGGKKNYFS